MGTIEGTRITLGGLAGVGKGSVSKLLAEELNYELMSAGAYFREIAEREGKTLSGLEDLAKKDPRYDAEVDKRTREYGFKNDHFVFEGRLAWSFINSFKILLVCGKGARIARVAMRDKLSFEEAEKVTMHREKLAERRYHLYYDIANISDPRLYDLSIDTTNITAEKAVMQISSHLKEEGLYSPKK